MRVRLALTEELIFYRSYFLFFIIVFEILKNKITKLYILIIRIKYSKLLVINRCNICLVLFGNYCLPRKKINLNIFTNKLELRVEHY